MTATPSAGWPAGFDCFRPELKNNQARIGQNPNFVYLGGQISFERKTNNFHAEILSCGAFTALWDSFFALMREPEWCSSYENVNTVFCLMDVAAAASVLFASLQGMPHLNRPELSENFYVKSKQARIGLKFTKQKNNQAIVGQKPFERPVFGQN